MSDTLQSEMTDWMRNPPEGCCLESCEPMMTWVVLVAGPDASPDMPKLYDGKVFRIQIKFTDKYPLEPPEVRHVWLVSTRTA